MNQQLDPDDWPSICFEGELLPQSVSGISILVHRDLTERTCDWIWSLRHCSEVWKGGEAEWCLSSAIEIINYLLEHRDEVAEDVRERLGPYGFDGQTTVNEWISALASIRVLAESAEEVCSWIAGEPSDEVEEKRRRFLAYLEEKHASGDI